MAKIYRYDGLTRASHWVHTTAMILLILTGLQVFTGFGFMDSFTVPFHVALGWILVAALVMEVLGFLINPREALLAIPTPKDIKRWVLIAMNFMGLTEKYPAYHIYSRSKKEYTSKWHPVLKFMIWGDMFFVIVIALSGFALYYPASHPLAVMARYIDLGTVRLIHFISFIYFLLVLIPHGYLALNPVNRGVLKSMIFGWDEGEDTVIVE